MQKCYKGLPITSPDEAHGKNPDATYIIATLKYRVEVDGQLNGIGAKNIADTSLLLHTGANIIINSREDSVQGKRGV